MIRRSIVLALALLPWPCALYLPTWILGKSLEQDVERTLPLAVGVIAALTLVLNTALVTRDNMEQLRRSRLTMLGRGLSGLLVGTALAHIVIILFGAPFQLLITRTALLALLLACMTTLPLSMHTGTFAWNDWVDIVCTTRARDAVEVHLASVAIGAMLGAYVGALPIPLDWDRPWQQWPLTCVYGVLVGNTVGNFAGVAIAEWMKKRKKE